MKRVKLTVAYDGTNYHGWQIQPNGVTIEEVLNQHLSELLQEPIKIIGASRTDAGVHARGNVAKAVENVIREKYPNMDIKMANAEGLKECRKLLTMAKAGKYNGYLLEGMACPGGCVAGAGTMQSIKKSQAAVNKYAATAGHKVSSQTEYVKELEKLVD